MVKYLPHQFWQHTPRWEHTNAHRPTPGPAQTKFAWVVICGGGGCRALHDGGWGLSPEASAKDDLSPVALAKGDPSTTVIAKEYDQR